MKSHFLINPDNLCICVGQDGLLLIFSAISKNDIGKSELSMGANDGWR